MKLIYGYLVVQVLFIVLKTAFNWPLWTVFLPVAAGVILAIFVYLILYSMKGF